MKSYPNTLGLIINNLLINKINTMNDPNAGYILTEIWNARPSWTNLTSEERANYFEKKINPLLMGMIGKGAEILGCAINDNTGN